MKKIIYKYALNFQHIKKATNSSLDDIVGITTDGTNLLRQGKKDDSTSSNTFSITKVTISPLQCLF